MTSFLNQPKLSRGVRNNNPGNLRRSSIKWKGKIPFSQSKDKDFEQFDSIENGIRAMVLDIYGDITKDKLNTLNLLIHSYAPPSENNTSSYVNDTAMSTGLQPDSIIVPSVDFFAKLIPAMIRRENGSDVNKIPSSAILAGITDALNYVQPKKKTSIDYSNESLIEVSFLIIVALLIFYYLKNK